MDTSERVDVERKDVFKSRPLDMLDPATAAERIRRGVEHNEGIIVFPFSSKLMWFACRLRPTALDGLLSKVIERFRASRIRQ